MRVVLVCLCLSMSLAGCRPSSSGASSAATVEKSIVLSPGKFIEASIHVAMGDTLEASYDASDLVQWNVHTGTTAQDVRTFAQGEGTAGTIRLKAPFEASYTVMWQNDNSSSVKMTVTIKGGKLEGWRP